MGATALLTATTITTGSMAATAPFMPINPLKMAAMIMIATRRQVSFLPVRRIRTCPAHAPTPATSSPVPIASRAAIRMTTGSPKPASTSCAVNMPVKYRASDAQTATIAAGMGFQTKSTMAAPMIASVMTISVVIWLAPCDANFIAAAFHPWGSGLG